MKLFLNTTTLTCFLLSATFFACEPIKIIVEHPGEVGDPPLFSDAKQQLKETKHSQGSRGWAWEYLEGDVIRAQQNTGKGQVVMLIGTGVDYNNIALMGNLALEQKKHGEFTIGKDFVTPDDKAYDQFGTDTEVAGLIAATPTTIGEYSVAGLLKKVTLYPVQYINHQGEASYTSFFKALEHAKELRPDVIYLNYSGFAPVGAKLKQKIEKKLKEMLNHFEQKGTPIIVAAGDSAKEVSEKSFDLLPIFVRENVFIVAGLQDENTPSWKSNYSSLFVLTAAPSEEVVTTKKGEALGVSSGTHLAAGHVTAAVALALSEKGSQITVAQIRKALLSPESSTVLPSLKNKTIGGSALNIKKFLQHLP